jgi:hypothetical protein
MLSITPRSAFILSVICIPNAVFANELCKGAPLSGIVVVEGPYVAVPQDLLQRNGAKIKSDPLAIVEGPSVKLPPSVPPDAESYKPTGTWPANLIQQGWHNLRKAKRPLALICRYVNGTNERIVLPDSTDTCILKPGLVVTCE